MTQDLTKNQKKPIAEQQDWPTSYTSEEELEALIKDGRNSKPSDLTFHDVVKTAKQHFKNAKL